MVFTKKDIANSLALISTGIFLSLTSCSNTGFKGRGALKQTGIGDQDAKEGSGQPSAQVNDASVSTTNKSNENPLNNDEDLKNKGKNGIDWFEDFMDKEGIFDTFEDLANGGKGGADNNTGYGESKDNKGSEKGKDAGNDKGKLPCEKSLGINGTSLKIAGNGQSESITIDTSRAIYVHGGSNALEAAVKNAPKVDAICLVVTGNLNKVTFQVATALTNLYIITHGNQPEVKVTVAKEASVGLASILMTGNQGKITFDGEGSHKCRSITKGNENTVTCKP